MPFKSKAQVRKFGQLLSEGKITKEQFDEWHSSTPNMKKLPERVKKKKKKGFATGFKKVALDLAEQALLESSTQMQDRVQGQYARENMTTAQAKGKVTNSYNVRNEKKEFGPQFKVKYDTSRSKAR